MFDELGVARAPSEMSFSAQSPQGAGRRNIEWSGNSLNTVFAQRRNLLRPVSGRCCATSCASTGSPRPWRCQVRTPRWHSPSAPFWTRTALARPFREDYFLPMVACIWSCPTEQMLRFPMATMIRFCHNHGLLQVANRPQWLHGDRGLA